MTDRSSTGLPEFAEVLAKLGVRGVWDERLQASQELLFMAPMSAVDPWTACEELRTFLAELPASLGGLDTLSFVVGVAGADPDVLDDAAAEDLRRWHGWQTELYHLQLRLVGDKEDLPSINTVADRLRVLIFTELDPFLTVRLRSLLRSQKRRALGSGQSQTRADFGS